MKTNTTEYDYMRRYNELKQSIDLVFVNAFDRILEVEIKTDCNIIVTLIPDDVFRSFINQTNTIAIRA